MHVQLMTFIILSLLFPFTGHAQKRAVVDANRLMSISYGSPSWNTDSAKIDTAFLVMRDKASNKIVQIQLEETEPDSSQFVGKFVVSLGEAEKIEPEIYIPPSDMRGGEKDYRKLYDAIAKGTLIRKPVIWKKNEKGQALIDVYDTREQAALALKAYQEEQKIAADLKKKSLVKPVPSESALAAAAQMERKAALDKLALEAAKREADRIRLVQIEEQRALELERAQKALNEKQRAERKARAKALADEAFALFNKGDFAGAEPKFKEATELDPEDTSHYFKYGVTLYRLNKFNEALVIIKMAKVEAERENEKKYFLGLCHYRLNEFEPSLGYLGQVAASKDPQMAPSALFYMGMIQFVQEKYEASKKSFETVIDTSGDPRMDEQAEEYIDRIAAALQFQKMRENKFTLTGVVGAMYDSNVLLSPDNATDQGLPTNIADFRLLTMAQLDYRPILNEHHEFSPGANASLTNSAKTESAKADPWLYDFYAPYTYKGVLWGKGYKMTAKPTYEMLFMDPEATNSKYNILSSYVMAVDNTFVMNKNWFSTYTIEFRMDDSKTSDSIGTNDADANKISFRTSQMAFLDKGRKEAIIASLGYVMNAAKGSEKKYNRIELGANYVRPTKWDASMSLGLNAYQINYPTATVNRTDLNVGFSAGLSKPIREWVTWGVIGNYTKNSSNVDTNTYTKYLVMTTATFVTNF